MRADDHPGLAKDILGICLRVLLLAIAVCSFILALSLTGGCDFLYFNPQNITEGITPTHPDLVGIGSAHVGLYRYDPDGEGCRDISDDFDNIGWPLTTAQVGNSLAIIFSLVALVCLVVDLFFCRFVCSRIIISSCYIVAFITQAMTFFVFAGDVCDPPFKDAAPPCDTDTGSYVSMAATVLFFITTFLACIVPKPLPIFVRIKRSVLDRDKSDPCCSCCKKREKEEEEDVEKGDEEATVEEEEEPKELTEEEKHKLLREQQTQAVVVTALATARRGKQHEIEKQLQTLTKYKEHMPKEEYEEKVALLLHALPDPLDYDTATKTDTLVPEEKEIHQNLEEQEEEIDVNAVFHDDDEEEKEVKKSGMVTSAIKSSGNAIKSGFTSIAKSVTPGSSSKSAAADVPQDAPQAPPEIS